MPSEVWSSYERPAACINPFIARAIQIPNSWKMNPVLWSSGACAGCGGGSLPTTDELRRISCTGGGAREQGLLRVDDWTCCGGCVGLRDKKGSRRGEWPSGQVGWAVSDKPNVSKKSIRIIVDLFFYGYFADTYPTRIHAVLVSDTYPIRDTSLPWRIGVSI